MVSCSFLAGIIMLTNGTGVPLLFLILLILDVPEIWLVGQGRSEVILGV